MFKLFIREYGSKELAKEMTFDTDSKVKNFIRNISTNDLEKKEYTFLKSKIVEYFFQDNYKEEFFTINGMGIKLNKMPNGFKREKNYEKKKKFNNRILNKALNNISEYLSIKHIIIEKGKFNNSRYHEIQFHKLDSLHNFDGYAKVVFDKLLWEHKIDFIKASEPKVFIVDIQDAFNKYTNSTRKLRRRIYANNIE